MTPAPAFVSAATILSTHQVFYMFISLDPPQEGGAIIAPTLHVGRKWRPTEVIYLARGYIANKVQKLGLNF